MAGFAAVAVPGFLAAVPDCGLEAAGLEVCGFAAGVCVEPDVGEVCANALEARSALDVRRINERVCCFFIQKLSH